MANDFSLLLYELEKLYLNFPQFFDTTDYIYMH